MVGEVAKKNLYDAATKGEVARFKQLLEEDPYLVDEVYFACSRNLLHLATMRGQAAIVEEVLKMNPQLARDVDSKNSSSLHIAAANGNAEIAKKLLSVAPEMLWWRDNQGMNPFHIAAMKGNVELLEMLLRLNYFPVMERVHRGQTVLHLCVKHHHFRALKVLVKMLGEFVYAKDDDGETILHLAVRCNQLETIRYLVESNKIEQQTPNSMGKTALEILHGSPSNATNYSEMERILLTLSNQSKLKALPKLTDTTMVVVLLIATMAFQAALSPPGGVWQDDTPSHSAGDAVMASTHPTIYTHFVRANTTAFVSSLITIFLITTRLPSGRIYFLLISVSAMWVSLASIAVSYGASVMVTTPNTETQSLDPIIIAVMVVSISIIGLILVCRRIRLLYLSWKSKNRRHENLTTDSFITRVFYWIFQRLETRDDVRADHGVTTIFARVLRMSDSQLHNI